MFYEWFGQLDHLWVAISLYIITCIGTSYMTVCVLFSIVII